MKALYLISTGQFRILLGIFFSRFRKKKNNELSIDSILDIVQWITHNVSRKRKPEDAVNNRRHFNEQIDIIVPVYNGFKYLDTLFETIKQTNVKYRLIVVDDASPDERVAAFLGQKAQEDKRIVIITNKRNLGFVQSVNAAFEHTCMENHIALLNTDIELPPMWLERLMHPIISMEKVASATPFTNSGVLCSFPRIGEDNALFEGLSCVEIDNAFSCISPVYTKVPTGVGFCMGLNKETLKAIGGFDAQTFSKGFGEENDWCRRAAEHGFTNILIENMFVYHKHCGSFTATEKTALLERNLKLLHKKHPDYDKVVIEHFTIDPHKHTREFVAMLLLSNLIADKTMLVFDHNLGGGATGYLIGQVKSWRLNGNAVITVRYEYNTGVYLLNYVCKTYEYNYKFVNISDLCIILDNFGCDEIIINELVTYPDMYRLLEFIVSLKKQYNAKLLMYMHDYFCVCPTVNLGFFDNRGRSYCTLPDSEMCESCFKEYHDCETFGSIAVWRCSWQALLSGCDEVVIFSESSRNILEKAFGIMSNIHCIPHMVDYIIPVQRLKKTTSVINIGLIGMLSYHKGRQIIEDMLDQIKSRQLNIRIILIGESEQEDTHKDLIVTGRYNKEALPLLMLQFDIDIIFTAAVWPETFSYTTEEAIQIGIPVAAFNAGAPAERVAVYEKGVLIDKIGADSALNRIIEYLCDNGHGELLGLHSDAKKNTAAVNSSSKTLNILFIGEYISFSSRYRVDHFREQLIMRGIASEYADVRGLRYIDTTLYDAVVIYRCRYTRSIEKLIKAFNDAGKNVYYDIDDFIFSYEEIRGLEFLTGEEYADFRKYSEKISRCMAMCGGFITSTNHMKAAIERAFPDKSVLINRNVASIEMTALSKIAKDCANRDKSKVVLGYFSGSRTHDGDFALISSCIATLLDKYSNLYLQICGCLTLPQELEVYKEKMLFFDFIDWNRLPELIATVDINLMPVEDTFFHKCKSENKWTEAALVAIPTVCSYNEELAAVIRNGENGYLCKDAREWESVLSRLIEEPDLRTRIGLQALNDALDSHTTIATAEQAESMICKMMS